MCAERLRRLGRAATALVLCAALGQTAGARAAAAPAVQVMVVGRGGVILAGPRAVTASAGTATVSGRRCTVAAGTPLSVLLGLRRSGGPAFSLRDYGRCGAAARNSAELFVSALAGEANGAQNGWEYKVGGLAGATGAADPSGISGDGRLLRAGQHVLWFWCQASAGGCQRTLELSAPAAVARGGTLAVKVLAYDNEGRGRAQAGVVVRLGSDFATTGASGQADLLVPGEPGRYSLSASRSGLVPAFPQTLVVR